MTTKESFIYSLSKHRLITFNSKTVNRSYTAIDFSIKWNDNIPVEKDSVRKNSVEESAVIIVENNIVEESQLRLPPIPKENNPKSKTEHKMESIFNSRCNIQVSVTLADDGSTWTPHIRLGEQVLNKKLSETENNIKLICDIYEEKALPNGVIK